MTSFARTSKYVSFQNSLILFHTLFLSIFMYEYLFRLLFEIRRNKMNTLYYGNGSLKGE